MTIISLFLVSRLQAQMPDFPPFLFIKLIDLIPVPGVWPERNIISQHLLRYTSTPHIFNDTPIPKIYPRAYFSVQYYTLCALYFIISVQYIGSKLQIKYLLRILGPKLQLFSHNLSCQYRLEKMNNDVSFEALYPLFICCCCEINLDF